MRISDWSSDVCSSDLVHIKQFDRPTTRNDFLVTIAPAEPQQIIGDSFRQHSHIIAIGIHAQGSVPLGKLGAVRSMDQWHMGVYRLRPTHCANERELAEGVVEMVIAPDNMRNAHKIGRASCRERVCQYV